MDLTGQDIVKTGWVYDELNDIMTVTFKDDADVVLGDMILEGNKFRSMLDAMSQVGRMLFPSTLDLTTRMEHKTNFDILSGEAVTEFS
jgi:hypothetical protein